VRYTFINNSDFRDYVAGGKNCTESITRERGRGGGGGGGRLSTKSFFIFYHNVFLEHLHLEFNYAF